MSAVLRIENLSVDFTLPDGVVPAVRGVDLAIAPGEVLALVGESGSGKSVTAAAVLGLLPRTARIAPGSSIRFHDTELVGRRDRELNTFRGSGIGMIFQNPVTSLDPSFRIGTQLRDTARLHLGVGRAEADQVAELWLDRVGIRDAARVLRAYPHELSGGMRQRVMIALASLSGPALLIADEPTTALDATVQKQILDLLLKLTRDSGSAVLLITHDFGVVSHTSSRVAVMRSGVVVEAGETPAVLADPQHDYTRLLIESVPEIGQRDAPRGLTVRQRSAPAAAGTSGATAPTAPVPILELGHVRKEFEIGGVGTGARRSSLTAVDDVSFAVRRGEVFGLIGESGSGKSTLARLAGALLPLTAGTVRFDGADVSTLHRRGLADLRRRFQYVFQDASTALNPRVSIGEQIARPLLRLRKATGRRDAQRLTTRALDLVGLDPTYADRYPAELSGGQRQRVGIARAIGLEPELLVLDEPTSALDVSTQARILQLLLDLKDELDLTYLLIGHNLAIIELLCDRIGVLEQGVLLETFDADQLSATDRHASTRALLNSVLPISVLPIGGRSSDLVTT